MQAHSQKIAAVLCFLFCLTGCGGVTGPSLAKVTGKVSYQDKPVPNATVLFSPKTGAGGIATGVTNSDGEFTLSTQGRAGCAIDDCMVSITAEQADPNAKKMTPEEYGKLVAEGKPLPASAKSLIPEKYASHQTSGLTAKVVSDATQNHFEFTLTD